MIGLFVFRLYDNQLIRQTEAGADRAEHGAFRRCLRERVEAKLADGIPLGAEIAAADKPAPDDLSPIISGLDLAGNDLLARRPMACRRRIRPIPRILAIGAKLLPLLRDTQRVTLAGFRILDPQGTVIAGRDEAGLSLAHVEEVAAALQERHRARTADSPARQATAADLFHHCGTGLRGCSPPCP